MHTIIHSKWQKLPILARVFDFQLLLNQCYSSSCTSLLYDLGRPVNCQPSFWASGSFAWRTHYIHALNFHPSPRGFAFFIFFIFFKILSKNITFETHVNQQILYFSKSKPQTTITTRNFKSQYIDFSRRTLKLQSKVTQKIKNRSQFSPWFAGLVGVAYLLFWYLQPAVNCQPSFCWGDSFAWQTHYIHTPVSYTHLTLPTNREV